MVSPRYKKNILFKNDPVGDIAIMDDLGSEIKTLEERNKSWKFPRLGLYASVELEQRLKKRYCERFYEHFDADTHIKIESVIAEGGWQQNDYAPVIEYIPFITRRINLIKARFSGADTQMLSTFPVPDYTLILANAKRTAQMDDIANGYKNAFINYLIWQDDVERLNKSLSAMQRLLGNYFHENQGDLRWLVQWVDKQQDAGAITLNHYWQSNSADDGSVTVARAFTGKGRRLISRFVTDELEQAVEQPLWIARAKSQFVPWYKNAYYGAWMIFCEKFGQGASLFKTEDEWMIVIDRLTGNASPYEDLLKTLETELFPEKHDIWPSLELNADTDSYFQDWLAHIKDFNLIRQAALADAVADNKAADKMANRISFKGNTAAKLALGAMTGTEMGMAKEAYKRYQTALVRFSGISTSTLRAYEVARAGFEDDPAQAKSAILAAKRSIDNIRSALGRKDTNSATTRQDAFWCLLTQPVDALWKYSVLKAGCHLQKLWDEEVLVETQGVYDRHRLVALLFGEKGYVDRFTQKNARPFIQLNSRRGYHARGLEGCQIAFRPEYLKFLESGKKWETASGGQTQSSYIVDVMAYPTDVNIDARVKPHMTQLVVQSAQGDMALVNRQYPIGEKFNWSPTTCGDVSLQIMLGDITLTKKYTGYCAFGKFLSEFKNGKKVFTGLDFPEFAPDFYRMGVRQIEVLYHFQLSQVNPILRLLKSAPGRPPTNIISCSG
jgi:type VI secretion system protein ImpL